METTASTSMTLNRRRLLAGLLACPICTTLARASDGPHWQYEGHGGAEEWANLDSGFKACAVGSEQSPIDLSNAIKAGIDAIKLDWKPQPFKVANNGHTIQLSAAPGSSMTIGKEKYDLLQFHFHTPSEHALGGKRTAMEVHFVHGQPKGRLAVVGALMTAGKKNAAFGAVMQAAPRTEGETTLAAALDPRQFLPTSKSLFRYEGSLTTPPCSEVVDWAVYEHSIEVAAADIQAFKAIFPMNARPLQSINRRFLLRGA